MTAAARITQADIERAAKAVKNAGFERARIVFVREYPGALERDVSRMTEPPMVNYNDFTRGKWPESMIARFHIGADNYQIRS